MHCPKCKNNFKFRLDIVVRSVALAAEIPEEIESHKAIQQYRAALESHSDMELDAADTCIAQLKWERRLALAQEAAAGKVDAASLSSEYLRSARMTARFLCPYCSSTLYLPCNLHVMDAAEWFPEETKNSAPDIVRRSLYSTDGLTEAEINIIEECQRRGVLQAFTDVFQYEYGGPSHAPKRVERTFLTFLRQAVQRKDLPRRLQNPFRSIFPNAQIEFWGSSRVVAATVNGEIYRFIPARVLRKSNDPRTMAMAAVTDPDRTRNFENWIRTRNGYVPEGAHLFLAELRSQSRGVRSGYVES